VNAWHENQLGTRFGSSAHEPHEQRRPHTPREREATMQQQQQQQQQQKQQRMP